MEPRQRLILRRWWAATMVLSSVGGLALLGYLTLPRKIHPALRYLVIALTLLYLVGLVSPLFNRKASKRGPLWFVFKGE